MRNRFVIFFIVLALVPALFLGTTAIYFIDLSHRLDVAALENQLIEQKRTEIKSFFTDTQGAMDIQVAFDQRSEIERDQQTFLLKGLLAENHAFSEVRLENLSGIITSSEMREGETGKSVSTSLPEQSTGGLEDVSLLPEFTVALAGKPYIGPVRQTLQGPMITLAMPVHNRNGDIIQILAADVSLSTLFSSIDKATLGNSGYLLVFDKSGSLISAPSSVHGLGRNYSHKERVAYILSGGSLPGTGTKDFYESYATGAPVFGVGKNVPDMDWVILAEWPVADADAVIDALRLEVLELTLLSVIAVLILAPLFVSRLTRPIHELRDAAKSVEEGKLDTTIRIDTGDELEELGEQFNTMTKGLRQLQELRNEFVHIVTHELRAPITAIKSATSLLREGDGGVLSQKASEIIEPIWISSNHLVNLVNDLLDVATSEAGKLRITIEQIAITPIIQEVERELAFYAKEHHVLFSYEAIQLPLVSADKLRVKQVIMNFISNGIKYNREGGTVTIQHEVLPSEILTHVSDNGKGMSVDEQKHLFQKFYRAGAINGKIEGTGLGLYIAKDLIEKMGGRVSTSSVPDVGTRFTFSLPRADIHNPNKAEK